MSQTEKCIVCLDKATVFTGHVKDGRSNVIAGWCKKHINGGPERLCDPNGCAGKWREEFGKEDDPWY